MQPPKLNDVSAPAPNRPAATPSYSTAEVARRFGVSIPTVQRWVDQGHLKAWKTVGGHRRIDADSAERFFHSQRGAPTCVLIVDDNPDDRDLLCALVEAALPDAVINLAGNGFEGLVSLGQHQPDVVITDIVMPHMDGIEMLRHICTDSPVRPRLVMAVSSRTEAQVAEAGTLPAGVQFLPKPIDPDRFAGVLAGAFRPAIEG